MRIGVISDPHGCLVGLKAAVDWFENFGVDVIVCAGDVARFGPQPNECVSLLAERGIATVQGNSERGILLPSPADKHTAVRISMPYHSMAATVVISQPKLNLYFAG